MDINQSRRQLYIHFINTRAPQSSSCPSSPEVLRYRQSIPVSRGLAEVDGANYLLHGLNRENHRIMFTDIDRILDANSHAAEVGWPFLVIRNIDTRLDCDNMSRLKLPVLAKRSAVMEINPHKMSNVMRKQSPDAAPAEIKSQLLQLITQSLFRNIVNLVERQILPLDTELDTLSLNIQDGRVKISLCVGELAVVGPSPGDIRHVSSVVATSIDKNHFAVVKEFVVVGVMNRQGVL